MTDAARTYNQMRIERVLLRLEKGGFTQQEEADYGAAMDVFWRQMTEDEQRAVEDSDVGCSSPDELSLLDQIVEEGEQIPPRVAA